MPAHCSTAFARSGISPYDPRVVTNQRVIKDNLSTTVSPPQQSIQTLSNELDSSPRSNNELIIQRNTLARSSSAPNLNIDRSTSATNYQFETNPTHIDTDFLIHDATASAYKVLDEVLDATNSLKSTTLSHEKPSTSITMTSPTEHIHLSSSNLSFNSTSSSAASTDSSSTRSLLAVEAIVAKYLSPKQSTTLKTGKCLIKRPYGVSITDLDVYGESIMKQRKKNNKLVNKKSTTSGDNESSKKCS
ncbi:unnamed protein product [Rotaria sp. Silwood1]|nr:unnamed protein product [Rotaria sp. Silwood1]CAF5133429.1 unnamed protein product [Rotaria sp. Silwood1]